MREKKHFPFHFEQFNVVIILLFLQKLFQTHIRYIFVCLNTYVVFYFLIISTFFL